MATMPAARPASQPAPAGSNLLHRPFVAVLVILGLGVLAYSNSFRGPFVFDDELSIPGNPTLHSLLSAWQPPTQDGLTVSGRPLLNVSLAFNYALSGTDVGSYHATNLAIHLGAALLLFAVLRRTFRTLPLAARHGEGAGPLALVITLVWLLHPLQTESVTYLVQRAESLVGLFYLLTVWCYLRAAETPGWKWRIATVAACAAGMASKEVMVSAPVVLALYDRVFLSNSWREVWSRRRGLLIASACTWAILAALIVSTSSRGGTVGFGAQASPVAYLRTQAWAIVHYLQLCLWPHPLVLDYGTATIGRWSEVLWQSALLAALAIATFWAAARAKPLGFLGFVFFAVLSPSSSFVPNVTQTVAEHRMYLPLAVVAVLAVLGLHRWLAWRGLVLAAAVSLVFGGLTYARNADYQSRTGLYEDLLVHRPQNARAMARLADYYRQEGDLEKARAWLERSDQTEPNVPAVLTNLGNVWQALGSPEKAVACFRRALVLASGEAAVRSNLANALIASGKVEEGLQELEAAVKALPDVATLHAKLGSLYAQQGRMADAALQFQVAVQLQPGDAEAHGAYASVLSALNRREEAIAEASRAVQLEPGNADLHNRLGTVLGRAGRFAEALGEFEEALRLDPAHPSARQNAARARQFLGTR